MKSCKRILLGLLLPALLLLAWWWATTYTDISHAILPSIPEVWRTLREFLADGTLAGTLGCSLSRVLKGYAIAAALGICAGSVMGMWHRAYDLLHPFITAVRQIPVIAWIPLIILWYGIGETSKVVVIAIAAFFPITLNTLGGFQSLPSGYLEVARLYRLSVSETFRKVYLPNALPQILVGLKLGLGSSWMAVVAAELDRRELRYRLPAELFAGTAALGRGDPVHARDRAGRHPDGQAPHRPLPPPAAVAEEGLTDGKN